jgi:hypothetical protein
MGEKLSNECIPIRLSFRKEQNPGREAIDAMYDKGSLPLQSESCRKQRQSGGSIGALDGHSRKSGRLIDDHDGFVFVKYGKLPRETRPPAIFAVCSGRSLHLQRLSNHSRKHRKSVSL